MDSRHVLAIEKLMLKVKELFLRIKVHIPEIKVHILNYLKWYSALACVLIVLGGYSLVRAFIHRGENQARKSLDSEAMRRRIIHLAPEIRKEYPIVLSSITLIEPSEEVLLPGRVQKDPTQTAIVTARAQGRITDIRIKEADGVKAGQILAVIQSTEVAQAQSEHLRILLRFELSQRQMDRSKELFEHQVVSAKDHELAVMEYESVKTELDASRTQLKYLNLSKDDIKKLEKGHTHSGELLIRSPIGGVVIERNAALGQSVSAEDSLFTIGNIDQIWIVLDVYEKDIPLLSEGMTADVLVPTSFGEPKVISAKVARIGQEIDSTTRSVNVWLEVKNTKHNLKFGQAISARIQGMQQDRQNKKIYAVPIEAVHKIEGETILFVRIAESEFEPRKVEVGWTSDKWMEIKSGLKSSEQFVSKGSFILKSEYLRN